MIILSLAARARNRAVFCAARHAAAMRSPIVSRPRAPKRRARGFAAPGGAHIDPPRVSREFRRGGKKIRGETRA